MPKRKIFSVTDFKAMIDDARSVKTLCAILTVASDYVLAEDMSPYAYAGVLRVASEKIYLISNH